MVEVQLIGFMCCWNEIDWIEPSIRSVAPYLDRLIVIEGAFGETILTGGSPRSDDGTLEVLDKLSKEYSNIEIHYHNEEDQLKQRDRIFDYIQSPCYLFILDGDEVWDKSNIQKVINIKNNIPNKEAKPCSGTDYKSLFWGRVWKFRSLTFINDLESYVPIDFPRLFKTEQEKNKFIQPNQICECINDKWRPLEHNNGEYATPTLYICKNIQFFHYSYVKSNKRFIQKRKERIKAHGQFKWDLLDGKVYSPGVNIRKFEGKHPNIIYQHKKNI